MEKKLLLALGAFLLLPACAGPQSVARPDWIEGNAAAYAPAQYLLGRGAAAQRADAEDRARGDLAKVFQVAVAAESEDVRTHATDGRESADTARVTRVVTTRTDQMLRGAKIAELWRDPQTGTHHALAVLPRLATATGLREDIERLDAATRAYLSQAREAPDPLRKIAAASRAVEAQVEREGHQRMLRVLDPAGRGVEPVWSAARLAADRDALLARVRVSARVEADAMEGLAGVLAGAVARAGFTPEPAEAADYTVEAALPLEDLGARAGWHWLKGALTLTLRDRHGEVRGTRRWDIKSAAQGPALARARALDEAEAVLNRELRQTVLDFAKP